MKNPNSIRSIASRSNRPTKRIRVAKTQRDPLEAPSYPDVFTLTILPDGAADGAYDQSFFRTRPNPTSF